MNLKYLLLIFFYIASSSLIAQEGESNPFSFKWDNGFKLKSADKNFELKFGGRLMMDHAFFWQNDALESNFGALQTNNGTEIRRARLYFSGTVYKNVEFKLNFDVAGGEVGIKDMYIGIKNIPGINTIRIGHLKEPFRLDNLTSSKYSSFMEPSFLMDFIPGRNSGVLILSDFYNNRLSAQAGLFRNARNGDDVFANNGYVITGRFSGLPLRNENNTNLLHLAASYSFRQPNTNNYRISSRPEAHLSSKKYIDTKLIENVDDINMLNFETAFISKSLSLQAEYLIADFNADQAYNFSTYYGQISYFLTGETKIFKSSYDGFDRVKPKQNFMGKEGGVGAWELALRYSNSDLNSKDIFGGEQSDITLGLNWHLNPVTRIMLNHVWADVKDVGKMNVFQARFQIDF